MCKLKCLLIISKWHSSIHWQLSVKAMNLAVNFFLQFSSVGCHLPRSQQLIFLFQNSLTRIFFFRSSLVSAYKSLFLQFRAQKGASLVFSECDKSTELMYIFSWTQKAIPVEPQCRRVKHWASEDYVIREMFLCQQLHWCVNWHHILWSFWNQVRALEKKNLRPILLLSLIADKQ